MNPEEMIKSEITIKNASAETSPGRLVSSQPPKRKSRWSVKNPEEIRGDPPEAEDAYEDNENLKNLKFVPKTERNIEKDQKPVQNLFQAIFGENDEEEEETKDKQMYSSDSFDILEQPIISTKPKISPEVASNLLRNMSPPCGIFAALFGSSEATEKNNTDNSAVLEPPIKKQCTSEEEKKLEYYGPALPTNLHMHMTEVIPTQNLDAKVVPSELRISSEGVEIVEKWVEKNNNNSTANSDTGDSSIIEKKKHKYKKSKKTKKSKKSEKKSKKAYKEKQHKSSKH